MAARWRVAYGSALAAVSGRWRQGRQETAHIAHTHSNDRLSAAHSHGHTVTDADTDRTHADRNRHPEAHEYGRQQQAEVAGTRLTLTLADDPAAGSGCRASSLIVARHLRLREPRHHWLLVCLLMAVLVGVLLLQGYVEGTGAEGSGPPPGPRSRSPSILTNADQAVDLSGAKPTGAGVAARTIALTFDDGPDPRWTPEILTVLRRHHAHATFFVLGSKVAQHPGLARQILADGNELGSHTYTHVDLARIAPWRRQVELALTQKALAGATARHTRLVRLPYSSEPSTLVGREYDAARAVSRDGYLVVLADHDTRDWSGRTPEQIVAAATPTRGRGAVVMMHDSGGDRRATVIALGRLLTRLQAKGYRFTTVSDGLRLPPGDVRVSMPERVLGWTVVGAQLVGRAAAVGLTVALGIAGVLTVARVLFVAVVARVHVRRARKTRRARRRAIARFRGRIQLPPISVVVPAYNEALGIAATIRSLVRTTYPGEVEVIVVDDGSTDATAAVVARLALPRVRLLRQPNSGKPAALSTGISAARYDLLVLVDGDTVFEPSTLQRLVLPFSDPSVGAVSGNTKVANKRGILGRWQHLEYVIGFNLDRRMYDVLECMPTVPGAIGAFRRAALADAAAVGGNGRRRSAYYRQQTGGWVSDDTLAEDTDLTMAICRTGWRVVCEDSARAWTEAPATLGQLWRQRYRWCYGTLQAMWKHRRAIVERGRSGRLGRRGLTYLLLFQVLLPLLAPAVDVFALYGLLLGQPTRVIGVWVAFAVLQVGAAAYALRMDGERLTAVWSLPLQQIVYRQLMYLVVLESVISAVLGTRIRWQHVARTGDVEAAPSAVG
ncbi:MAG TPA: bifunctional polysaccharide deacetylase/glycosyltransferase family 2 protein [Actinopolymorphaceae bacterium]|nr:bifunctional polysaccharide deacetylase/glycosyltransferase family 2 protein [Actinopolymorphaceae bacterium]